MIDMKFEVKFVVQRSTTDPGVMLVDFTDIYGETHNMGEWCFEDDGRYELIVDLVPEREETLEREDD